MNLENIYNIIIFPWIGLGVFAFVLLFFITAPYGRHSKKIGLMMSGKWGWIIQEIISPICFGYFFLSGESVKTPAMWIFFILWIGHYFNRSVIYPLRQKNAKDTAIIVVVSAIFFNIINGFINGYYLGSIATTEYQNYIYSNNFIIGITVFIIGLIINIKSDEILFEIRKEKNGYRIPQTFLYNYISCPNYFGEILEWSGFAIMVWNFPGLIFVLWTICNLVPRAISHHKWYHKQFPDYPTSRKAIIPFIL